MNEFAHFLTGYLIARRLKDPNTGKYYEYYRFECFLVAFAAFSLDLDFLINRITPMEHGVYSHTILGAISFAFGISIVTSLIMKGFSDDKIDHKIIPFTQLFKLATIGVLSHLLLDLVPYLPDDPIERAGEIDHHMYLWPISKFPFHFNLIFPGYTYQIRVIVEIIYTLLIGLLLLYLWLFKGQLFVKSMFPFYWDTIDQSDHFKRKTLRREEIITMIKSTSKANYLLFIFLYGLLFASLVVSLGILYTFLFLLGSLLFLLIDNIILGKRTIKSPNTE